MKCIVEDCARVSNSNLGYCSMHYKRWRRNGTTDRIQNRYNKTDTCWYCGGGGPLRNYLCNACATRKQRKGYIDRDRNKKGEGSLRKDGYRLITVDGEQILEHRHVMEKKLGRKLKPGEVVHHEGVPRNINDPHRLMLFPSQGLHRKYHAVKK